MHRGTGILTAISHTVSAAMGVDFRSTQIADLGVFGGVIVRKGVWDGVLGGSGWDRMIPRDELCM